MEIRFIFFSKLDMNNGYASGVKVYLLMSFIVLLFIRNMHETSINIENFIRYFDVISIFQFDAVYLLHLSGLQYEICIGRIFRF